MGHPDLYIYYYYLIFEVIFKVEIEPCAERVKIMLQHECSGKMCSLEAQLFCAKSMLSWFKCKHITAITELMWSHISTQKLILVKITTLLFIHSFQSLHCELWSSWKSFLL